MEVIVVGSLMCYSILISVGIGAYYRENKVLRRQNEELLKAVTTQKAVLQAQMEQESDMDRQLSNLFIYNGTSIGQKKRGDN